MNSKALSLMLILTICGLIPIAAGDDTNPLQQTGLVSGQAPSIAPPRPAPNPPAPPSPPAPEPAEPLARWTGHWNVEFANGIHEVHELREDHSVTVKNVAENWSTQGRIGFDGERVTILCNGGGMYRWTPVGDRMVVEYWYSSSQLQTMPALLCIGERVK